MGFKLTQGEDGEDLWSEGVPCSRWQFFPLSWNTERGTITDLIKYTTGCTVDRHWSINADLKKSFAQLRSGLKVDTQWFDEDNLYLIYCYRVNLSYSEIQDRVMVCITFTELLLLIYLSLFLIYRRNLRDPYYSPPHFGWIPNRFLYSVVLSNLNEYLVGFLLWLLCISVKYDLIVSCVC